jgi:hypothetical protein
MCQLMQSIGESSQLELVDDRDSDLASFCSWIAFSTTLMVKQVHKWIQVALRQA